MTAPTFAASIYCRSCGARVQHLQGIEAKFVVPIGQNISKTAPTCPNGCHIDKVLNVEATIVWQLEPVKPLDRVELVEIMSLECVDLSHRQKRLRDAVIQLLDKP